MKRIGRLRDWLAREHRHGRLAGVVLDIDGVLMRDHAALPGSRELLELLAGWGVPYRLLTNDGCSSIQQKSDSLRRAGLEVPGRLITSTGHVLGETVRRNGWRQRRFFLMGNLGTPCWAEAAGLRVAREPVELEGEGAEACFGVLVGERSYDWETVINAVINYLLRNPSAPLVVPNPDDFFPAGNGSIHLSSGAVAYLITGMLSRQGVEVAPHFLGKPYRPMFAYNHPLLATPPPPVRRVVFVGDSLTGDIAGGRAFGYRTVLTLTGISTEQMLRRARVKPHLVCESL